MLGKPYKPLITTQHYVSRVYAVVICLSIRLSQVGCSLSKWLHVQSRRQFHTIGQGLIVMPMITMKFRWSPSVGAQNTGGVG